MLVLSRRIGGKIVIGDNITITVIDIDRGRVQLGIRAPRDVGVYREEIADVAQRGFKPDDAVSSI